MAEGNKFPITHSSRGGTTVIPWRFVEPLRASCLRVHDQTLERLAQRGGLDITELRGHAEAVEAGKKAKFSEFKSRADDQEWLKGFLGKPRLSYCCDEIDCDCAVEAAAENG